MKNNNKAKSHPFIALLIFSILFIPLFFIKKNDPILEQLSFGTPKPLVVAATTHIDGTTLIEATKQNIENPSPSDIVNHIAHVFGPYGSDTLKKALLIAICESGLKHDAYNHNTNNSHDYGIFQINSIHEQRFGSLYKHNYIENIRVAHALYKEQGFTPWVCAKKIGI